jgi:aminoglycoside phosphotransferase (APT) family kinase protein
MEPAAARAALTAAFPELEVRSVRRLPGGWDFLTLEVNRRWVFRFPVRPESEEQIRREFALLPLIASQVRVPVPEYRFRKEPSGIFRHRFGGYSKLGGIRVDRAGLSARALRRAGTELGASMTEVHGLSRERAVAAGVPYRDSNGVRRTLRRWSVRVLAEVRPLLDPADRTYLDVLLEAAARRELYSFRTVISHQDLLPVHVLVDPRTGALSGLIDWGDSGFGDPALDFAGLGDIPHLGPAMYRAYRGTIDPGFLERADAYRRLAPCHAILYARATRDPVRRDRSLRRLTRSLRSGTER